MTHTQKFFCEIWASQRLKKNSKSLQRAKQEEEACDALILQNDGRVKALSDRQVPENLLPTHPFTGSTWECFLVKCVGVGCSGWEPGDSRRTALWWWLRGSPRKRPGTEQSMRSWKDPWRKWYDYLFRPSGMIMHSEKSK